MSNTIIAEGKTTNEAIENGLKELKVSKSKVNIKVLDEEKRSFYNILAPRVVKVELTLKEDGEKITTEGTERYNKKINTNEQELKIAVKNIENFLKNFFNKEIKHNVEIKEYIIYVNLQGENVNHLIGYRGENINALQIILTSIANKNATAKIKVFLDISGYKEKRVKTLQELAEKIARTVIRTGKSVTLEPMTAYERKIIHTQLQENIKVETYSKGEEPYRKVVIKLK